MPIATRSSARPMRSTFRRDSDLPGRQVAADKTVVRGGFGIFYDALPAVIGDQFMVNLPGLVEERIPHTPWGDTIVCVRTGAGAASAAAIMSGFANGASFASLKCTVRVRLPHPDLSVARPAPSTLPNTQQWSFGIQQALGDQSSRSLGYVGNHGIYCPSITRGSMPLERAMRHSPPLHRHGSSERCSSTPAPASPTTTA